MASHATGPANDQLKTPASELAQKDGATSGPADDQLKTPVSKLAQKDGATLDPTEGSETCNLVFKTKYLYYRDSSYSRHSDTDSLENSDKDSQHSSQDSLESSGEDSQISSSDSSESGTDNESSDTENSQTSSSSRNCGTDDDISDTENSQTSSNSRNSGTDDEDSDTEGSQISSSDSQENTDTDSQEEENWRRKKHNRQKFGSSAIVKTLLPLENSAQTLRALRFSIQQRLLSKQEEKISDVQMLLQYIIFYHTCRTLF